MGQKRNDADRAEPPAPVSGAPMGRGVVVVTDEARGVTGVPPDVPVVIGVVVVVAAAVVAVVTAVVDVVVAGATVVGVVVTTGGGAKRQVGTVIVLSSIVTAPLIARARPFTVAPVFSVIDVVARIDPAKSLVVPKVAELPTCQNTLHACAPFSSTTELADAVVNVDPASKMNTESGSPAPLSVTVPVRPMEEVHW